MLLIVNVASNCGLAKVNYEQLNELYEKYKSSGFRILAFPCNQFGAQEPGRVEEIKKFLAKNKVKFDVFEKIEVNGSDAHLLWRHMKLEQEGALINAIKWNFTKFLISRQGLVRKRYGPTQEPLVCEGKIFDNYFS